MPTWDLWSNEEALALLGPLYVVASGIILGAPTTKKNSQRMVEVGRRCRVCHRGQFSRPLPSAKYMSWHDAAKSQVAALPEPIREPVNLFAVYYREAKRGDLINYHEALCDLLEDAGVLSNDRLVVSTDGSRLDKDADNPRIEWALTIGSPLDNVRPSS